MFVCASVLSLTSLVVVVAAASLVVVFVLTFVIALSSLSIVFSSSPSSSTVVVVVERYQSFIVLCVSYTFGDFLTFVRLSAVSLPKCEIRLVGVQVEL